MNLTELISFIKLQGCRVTVYRKKRKIGNAIGLFYDDPPHIKIAIQGRENRQVVSTLLHEYGHFCQFKDGFSGYLDGICWSHNLYEEWINRKIELTDLEKFMIRNVMLTIEYDAEMRAIKLGEELKVEGFDKDYHMADANRYMSMIKWAFANRREFLVKVGAEKYSPVRLTHVELFAPLTEKENKILRVGA